MRKNLTLLALLMASAAMTWAQDTWTVAGSAAALNGSADWAQTNAENDMTSTDGTTYTLTVTGCTLEQGITYQYKVVKDHAWDEAYPAQNKTFTVAETAVYTVVYTFNAETKDVSETTTKTGNAGEVTHTYSIAGSPQTVFGGSKAWDEASTDTDMQLGADGLYWWKASGVELPASSKIEFKIVVDHSWGTSFPTSNYVENIADAGTYDVTITFNATTKDVNCIVDKKGESDVESTFIIAGSLESLFGTTWDGTNEANKMEKGADGIWTKTYTDVTLTAGTIEWKVVQNGSAWIPEGEGNNLEVNVPKDGAYDLIFTYDEATETPASKLMQDGKEVIAQRKGDVNGDKTVDVADISAIISVMAGSDSYETADVNGDGTVDVADISSVISIMAE